MIPILTYPLLSTKLSTPTYTVHLTKLLLIPQSNNVQPIYGSTCSQSNGNS